MSKKNGCDYCGYLFWVLTQPSLVERALCDDPKARLPRRLRGVGQLPKHFNLHNKIRRKNLGMLIPKKRKRLQARQKNVSEEDCEE